jgi:toxin-antitoxin system PIN domain toxin
VILPDVNVLIYAFRRDTPQHARCRAWLNRILSGDEAFGISPLSLAAVVRVTTNPRSYAAPSALAEAFAFGEELMAQPHCQVVTPGERHWNIFRNLCIETGTRGGDTTDGWYAALAIEWGCEWITLDRDYARFSGLHWSAP